MKSNLGKLAIVAVLIIIVAGVILVKQQIRRENGNKESIIGEAEASSEISIPKPSARDSQPEEGQEIITTTDTSDPTQIRQNEKSEEMQIDKNVLALINGVKITEHYLEQRLQSLPAHLKGVLAKDKEALLDQLIVRELLYQEAETIGLTDDLHNISDLEEKKDAAIGKLINYISSQIEISESEMKSFYEAHKKELGGASFEQAEFIIEGYLSQEKQQDVIDEYTEGLKSRARIVRNEKWIAEQRALKPPNPLDNALQSKKPTVFDLGAGRCVPCKMMKPIFEELEKEYKNKANIILLEISDYRDLAARYRVRVIPTQIFFDKDGKEYWRHEGFLPKEEIVKRLKELGVE